MIAIPQSLSNAAHERAKESKAFYQKNHAKLESGNALECEADTGRKMRRMRAVTGLDSEKSAALAKYEASPRELGLTGEARLGAERIQGKTNDFVGVSFLDLARAAANCVGRVVTEDSSPLATGFLISEHLFITNNHVIPDARNAGELMVEFNYELDIQKQPKMVSRFKFAAETFFITSPENELDFTIIAIGKQISGSMPLSSFGFSRLMDSDDKHTIGEFVNIIQHPDGDFKQVVLRENQIFYRFPEVIHYAADTNPGSSGSPVFNDQWEAVALHHWGEPFVVTEDEAGNEINKSVNEGIRISAIVKKLNDKKSTLTAAAQVLLNSALDFDQRQPSNVQNQVTIASIPEPVPTPEAIQLPAPIVPQPSPNAGSITWTIPIQITVQLGEQTPAQPALVPSNIRPTASEKIKIDPDYSNRNGYNPRFLTGFKVELPQLNPELAAKRARKTNPSDNEDPFELTYQHFSIVMNRERRMAYFTAVNIDGSTLKDITRKEESIEAEGAEASEVWYLDPRIAPADQCDQSLYDAQRPVRVFDRGHLVRRLDPVWGTQTRAERANADSFHFTNCTPQQKDFNQRAKYWQGIEKYVLDNARAEKEKVSVFTGPVFKITDPVYRYVQVPMQFWKILVRIENEHPKVTAMVANQTERITGLPESFANLGSAAEYQTTVVEIEKLTGLDFGNLRDFDTYQGGAEAITTVKKIEQWNDLSL